MSTRKRTSPRQDTPVQEIAAEERPAPDDPQPVETIEQVPSAAVKRAADGRPGCYVDGCSRPEFLDGAGLCGAHWSIRPDLRKVARRHE